MFLVPKLFWGRASKFLNLIYNFVSASDHVAKFRRDRPRERGDALKKKHHEQNRRPPVLPYTGGLNNTGGSVM